MGRNVAELSEKQVATLEWIRDGCAAVDDETLISRRIRASSLHRRKLVSVKGRSATWRATITKAGLAWLEQHPSVDIVAPAAGAADDLFARVEAAGGKLQIGEGKAAKDACQELVRVANNSTARPRGWKLEFKGSYWGGGPHIAGLVRYWEDFVDLVAVPVPEHVARYHPAVKGFLADRDWQMVSKDHVPRAARILQAVADEALRRVDGPLTNRSGCAA